MTQVPITYYPPGPQAQLEVNHVRIRGKPYAHYFDDCLWLDAEALPALQKSFLRAQGLARSDINRLLEPGYLDGEIGYHAFEDGSGYVASLVKFSGVSIEALRWWWWHSVESERYLHESSRSLRTEVRRRERAGAD